MEDKRKLRQAMLKELKAIPESEYNFLSMRIADTLYEQPEWEGNSVIGITISRPPEVDTYDIIKHAWSEGKKVAVPKCLPDSRQMEFRFITSFDQLETVYYGLSEPIREETEPAGPADIGLLVVPGVAFTKEGFRLGFGGGYYDRFLPAFHGKTISLAFTIQLVEDLPIESHDQPVSKIITDQKVIFR